MYILTKVQKITQHQTMQKLSNDVVRAEDANSIISTLTRIKGIGQWTAEIYLIFSLGRQDIFASGDLALQEATFILFGLPVRPTQKELRILSESWSPWRSVAARLLWAYYKTIKSKEEIR